MPTGPIPFHHSSVTATSSHGHTHTPHPQDRDATQRDRIEWLESEVQRLAEGLKMETTAVNSLKRQLLEFSEIAERHKATLRWVPELQ